MGKRDELRGLKENVIIGRLIASPCGTGMTFHIARTANEDMDGSERRAITCGLGVWVARAAAEGSPSAVQVVQRPACRPTAGWHSAGPPQRARR
jgi:hypothetical protein